MTLKSSSRSFGISAGGGFFVNPKKMSSSTKNNANVFDMFLYQNELDFQQNQLGIDYKSLETKANILELNVEKFIVKMVNESPVEMKSMNYKFLTNSPLNDKNIVQDLNKIPALLNNSTSQKTTHPSGSPCNNTNSGSNPSRKVSLSPVVGSIITASAISNSPTYWTLVRSLNLNHNLAEICFQVVRMELGLG